MKELKGLHVKTNYCEQYNDLNINAEHYYKENDLNTANVNYKIQKPRSSLGTGPLLELHRKLFGIMTF